MRPNIIIATNKAERDQCYELRHLVFVEEQNVPIDLEIDEHDETDAVHYLGIFGTEPIAAARIVPSNGIAKLGRLVVLPSHRGKNIGAAMMNFMVEDSRSRRLKTVTLDAQTYAQFFYERLGFVSQGPEFMDAGIAHIRMTMDL